jgi:hypothetical protein
MAAFNTRTQSSGQRGWALAASVCSVSHIDAGLLVARPLRTAAGRSLGSFKRAERAGGGLATTSGINSRVSCKAVSSTGDLQQTDMLAHLHAERLVRNGHTEVGLLVPRALRPAAGRSVGSSRRVERAGRGLATTSGIDTRVSCNATSFTGRVQQKYMFAHLQARRLVRSGHTEAGLLLARALRTAAGRSVGSLRRSVGSLREQGEGWQQPLVSTKESRARLQARRVVCCSERCLPIAHLEET